MSLIACIAFCQPPDALRGSPSGGAAGKGYYSRSLAELAQCAPASSLYRSLHGVFVRVLNTAVGSSAVVPVLADTSAAGPRDRGVVRDFRLASCAVVSPAQLALLFDALGEPL